MMMHVKKYRKDGPSKQKLQMLLTERNKVRAHLIKTDFHRYRLICADYGIPETYPRSSIHSTKLALRENSWVGKYC